MGAARLRVFQGAGLTLAALLVCVPARAQASRVRLQLRVALDACPNAALLQQTLEPLLDADTELSFDAPEADPSGEPARGSRASVNDLGPHYIIDVNGVQRDVDDVSRNCLERARVAAVFIALNVKGRSTSSINAPVPAPAPTPAPVPDSETESDSASDTLPARWTPALQLFAQPSYALAIDHASLGGGLGVALARRALRLGFTAASLAPVSVALDPRGGALRSVQLMRLPLALTTSYLVHAGGFEFGPALGFELDVLRMRGQDVLRPQTALRINPGALLAADAHLGLGPAWFAILRVGLCAFPRAYDLSVDPTGTLGHTPRLWLDANLGIEWRFQ